MSLSSDVPDLILCDFNQCNVKSMSNFFWLICCSTRLHKTIDLWFLQRSVTPPPLLITTLSFLSQHSSPPLLERGKVGTREEALWIGNAKGACNAQTAMFLVSLLMLMRGQRPYHPIFFISKTQSSQLKE